MDIQFMKDYYDLRYEETDGENHFVEETAYQEKQSEQSKMEDQLMEMVGGSESNVWKLSMQSARVGGMASIGSRSFWNPAIEHL